MSLSDPDIRGLQCNVYSFFMFDSRIGSLLKKVLLTAQNRRKRADTFNVFNKNGLVIVSACGLVSLIKTD
jgi:hypothetical protein